MSSTARNLKWLAATPASYHASELAKQAALFAAAVKLISGSYTA